MNLKNLYWLDTSHEDSYDEKSRWVFQHHLCTVDESAVLGKVWCLTSEQPGIWYVGLAPGVDPRNNVAFITYSSLDAAKAALEHYVDGMIDLEPYKIRAAD